PLDAPAAAIGGRTARLGLRLSQPRRTTDGDEREHVPVPFVRRTGRPVVSDDESSPRHLGRRGYGARTELSAAAALGDKERPDIPDPRPGIVGRRSLVSHQRGTPAAAGNSRFPTGRTGHYVRSPD